LRRKYFFLEDKINYLWQCCKSFGKLKCETEIIKTLKLKHFEEGENISIWAAGSGQQRLNQICKHCNSAQFFIEKRECPVCRSNRIEALGLKGVSYGSGSPSRTVYYYECLRCRRRLYALKELK